MAQYTHLKGQPVEVSMMVKLLRWETKERYSSLGSRWRAGQG